MTTEQQLEHIKNLISFIASRMNRDDFLTVEQKLQFLKAKVIKERVWNCCSSSPPKETTSLKDYLVRAKEIEMLKAGETFIASYYWNDWRVKVPLVNQRVIIETPVSYEWTELEAS